MRRSIKYIFIGYILLGIVAFIGCEKQSKTAPVADFAVYPESGDSLTVFFFDASPSQDNETESWRLRARWDASGDGIWDSDYTIHKKFAWRFSSEGVHKVNLEILDSDGQTHQVTKEVFVQPYIRDSMIIDSRDNKSYKVAYIYGQWWMSENLRYGEILQKDQFPRDNGQVEMYLYDLDPGFTQLYGGFYTWDEASHYKRDSVNGICPDGWRFPVKQDVLELNSLIKLQRDLDKYLGIDGEFHFELPYSGRYYFSAAEWSRQDRTGNFWLNNYQGIERFSSWLYYHKMAASIFDDKSQATAESVQWNPTWGDFTYNKIALPVRCIKK